MQVQQKKRNKKEKKTPNKPVEPRYYRDRYNLEHYT
jgi:hypothetical protein